MKHTALLAALAALLFANPSANAQGALNPPGAPAESQKSLQEIYDAIQTAKAEFAALVQQVVPSVPGMVAVLGGTLPEGSEIAGEKVETFYIGKYEVTWGEWKTVRDWAVANGYNDLADTGTGASDQHPVRLVTWYDVVKWCNAKSEKEGLQPVYYQGGQIYRLGEGPTDPYFDYNRAAEYVVDLMPNAKGYRLAFDAEWEWAARGGIFSKGYTYSGSDDLDSVAWFEVNSTGALDAFYQGRGHFPIGLKDPNKLGLYDMSGNVVEWCWDSVGNWKRVRGGHFAAGDNDCSVNLRGSDATGYRDSATFKLGGFRLARSY
jgi:sulfatase modifying factor 1